MMNVPHCAMLLASLLLVARIAPGQTQTLPLRPGVGSADRRVPVDVAVAPWNGLVRVQTELGERCSGFLVAPRLVMTAAHCLYLPRVDRFILPDEVHVLLAYRAGSYAAHARVARFMVPSHYRPRDEATTAGEDRALLTLDHAIGDAVVPVAPAPDRMPAPVRLAGYGQDRDEVAVAEPGCALIGRTTDGGGRPLLVHDCEATRGTSGAPVLWRRPDGRWAAVGIQIEADAGAGGRAVPISTP